MLQECMPFPKSEQEWLDIAQGFQDNWNFPHCLGALDGKHVSIQKPPNSGSIFFNYKVCYCSSHFIKSSTLCASLFKLLYFNSQGTFSIVLMALVKSNLQFVAIEVGAPGECSDGGIFRKSRLGKGFMKNSPKFHLPERQAA
jgi:hypothetical protein